MPLRPSATACQTSSWKAKGCQPRPAIQASACAPGRGDASPAEGRGAGMRVNAGGMDGSNRLCGSYSSRWPAQPTDRRPAMKRRTAAALLVLAACTAAAQTPDTLRIVSGYAPGGATDRVARIVGEKLQAKLGINVLVENKTGAGGRL